MTPDMTQAPHVAALKRDNYRRQSLQSNNEHMYSRRGCARHATIYIGAPCLGTGVSSDSPRHVGRGCPDVYCTRCLIADVTTMQHPTAVTTLQSTTVLLIVYLLISALISTAEAGFWPNELQEPIFPTVPSTLSSKGRGTPVALRVQCLMACYLPWSFTLSLIYRHTDRAPTACNQRDICQQAVGHRLFHQILKCGQQRLQQAGFREEESPGHGTRDLPFGPARASNLRVQTLDEPQAVCRQHAQ